MADVQVRALSFTEAVIRRPGMYTVTGSFVEVICFLEGYYSGIAKGNYEAAPVVEWSDFLHWLAEHLGVSGTETFCKIQESYNDDSEQLEALEYNYAQSLTERT